MLSAASLGYLSAQDPVLYEFLTGMVGSFNQLQKKLGIDAVPASQANAAQALPAPAPPASLAVTASLGVFTVTVGASPNAQPGVQYILEIASDTGFSAANTSVLALGAALGMTLNLGSVTRYFRVRAKYPTSAYSVYTYYGTASQPIGVVGGTAAFSAVEVDGGGTITDLNLSSTTPAAPAGAAQVKFQHDALTPEDVSAYLAAFGPSGAGHGPGAVPDPGAVAGTTKFLCEDGTFKAPGASSGVASLDGITGAILLSPGVGIAIADNTPGAGDIEIAGVVFGPSGAGHAAGLVPDPGSVAGTTKFLREDGTFAVPPGGSAGALVLLEQHTASSSAELDFTTCITPTYDEYLIELLNVVPSTSGSALRIQFSTDGGSTYDGTAGHYSWGGFFVVNNANANQGNDTDSSILLIQSIQNTTADPGASGSFRLLNPGSSTTHKSIYGQGTCASSTNSGKISFQTNAGEYLVTTAVTAFRVLMNNGTIALGTVRVYGIAKS